MGYMKEGFSVARGSAWSKFGAEYWRWFVFGPIVARLIFFTAAVATVVVSVFYVAEHAGAWFEYSQVFFKAYMLPSILVAVGLIVYVIGAVLAWHVWGYIWKFRGLKASGYTAVMSSVIILVGVTIVGLSTWV